jgi:hypothetical protein
MKVKRRINMILNDPEFIRKDNEKYWTYLAIHIRKVREKSQKNKEAREDWKVFNKQ